jgi:glutamate synthase (NADPH/NADH) small chain
MGKPTGFMEYSRQDVPLRDATARIQDWEEFHLSVPVTVREEQGARCMNCGVPFCQAGIEWEGAPFGCPLHNLIPEWNDMILSGNWSHALARLMKTNNFPEFTGRVCPAPCERACLCSMYESAVTIRDNELCVIEKGFELGNVKPRRAPQRSGQTVAVVGSGPAGLAAADQLNHRGHSVTVFEREDRPGGLLTYGIPNMKLPKWVVERRVKLMEEEGVTFVTGTDAADPEVAKRLLEEYDAVVLCCGAEKLRPLALDTQGVSGVCYGVEFLKASVQRQQLGLEPTVPTAEGKDVVIIGTGDTASDCVATALRQGCKSVIQLVRRKREDYLDQAGNLPTDYAQEEALAVLGEDPRRFSLQVQELVRDENGSLTAVVTTDGDTLPCQLLIAATGASGCREDVCRAFGVEADSVVHTGENSYQTAVDKVFAAGDMRRGQSLVVWAIAEGRSAAAQVDRFLTGYTNLS